MIITKYGFFLPIILTLYQVAMTICLQFGQYGNQIGEQFFTQLLQAHEMGSINSDSEYIMETLRKSVIPRAILIDMEPKVVNNCLSNKFVQYDSRYTIVRQSGAGNNWAHGFYGFGTVVSKDILECTRKQAEALNKVPNFLTFSSLAGGTGSGLSSKILEHLRDNYPKSQIATNTVFPYQISEINTQSLNAALSLSRMLDYSNQIIPFSNDEVKRACTLRTNEKRIQLQQINVFIARYMALGLADSTILRKYVPTTNILKLISVIAAPCFYDDYMQPSKLKNIQEKLSFMTKNGAISDARLDYSGKNKQQYVSGAYIIRGDGSFIDMEQLYTTCQDSQLFKANSAYLIREHRKVKDNKCVGSALLNGIMHESNITQISNDLIEKLARNAYIHFYEKFGLEEHDFTEALAKLYQLQYCYSHI